VGKTEVKQFWNRSLQRWLIVISCVTLLTAATFAAMSGIKTMTKPSGDMKHFVISWVGSPSSWDPLDFDNAQNLFTARMLYATPVEASPTGDLVSRVLESFAVNSDSTVITLTVAPNLKFEDATPLTADDVAFAIARMAFVRPKFPVLESILGLDMWRKSSQPLKGYPQGISVSDRVVTIQLNKSELRPLFRFSLEPFSIIPRRCVDTATNKLKCLSGCLRIA
jgi:ABC-type transport system substrate-binding protein